MPKNSLNTRTTSLVLGRYYLQIGGSIKINSDDDIAEILHNAAVQHFKQYPFHSLYFNLNNKNIHLKRNALIQQLLVDQGGSCYHHNAVFQAILEDNGIISRFISCLVHDPMNPGKVFDLATHITIVFDYKGQTYLFDPGWDGTALSIYSLPGGEANSVTRHGKHQVRRTNNSKYPFSFEELKADGTAVIRYDFNLTPTNLVDHEEAIKYLNSKDYAFETLFLFTRILTDDRIIRLVNRRLIKQTIDGKELDNAELPEDVAPIEKLTELFGSQEGLMADLKFDAFKNEDLGKSICQSTPTPNITPTVGM